MGGGEGKGYLHGGSKSQIRPMRNSSRCLRREQELHTEHPRLFESHRAVRQQGLSTESTTQRTLIRCPAVGYRHADTAGDPAIRGPETDEIRRRRTLRSRRCRHVRSNHHQPPESQRPRTHGSYTSEKERTKVENPPPAEEPTREKSPKAFSPKMASAMKAYWSKSPRPKRLVMAKAKPMSDGKSSPPSPWPWPAPPSRRRNRTSFRRCSTKTTTMTAGPPPPASAPPTMGAAAGADGIWSEEGWKLEELGIEVVSS